MPRNNKTDQLRVRLTESERKALDAVLTERQKTDPGATISDIIREFISPAISASGSAAIIVNNAAATTLHSLSRVLGRDSARVVESALNDIAVASQGETPAEQVPLIVKEIRLRRAYNK